jgi:two-component system, NtrC family, sensor kinase
MKTLGEAAMELPWLAPSARSLTVLAKSSLPQAWNEVRNDPGVVLQLARLIEKPVPSSVPSDVVLLESFLRQQDQFAIGFLDWNQPGAALIQRVCCRTGWLASQLANKVGVEDRLAWIAGYLSPLGWLALAAADPSKISFHLEVLSKSDVASWQQHAWGHDHTALTRRMCRAWRLPAWCAAIVGNLVLPANITERLGAPPRLFQVVHLAISLLQARGDGLGLAVGANSDELIAALNLPADEVDVLADLVVEAELPKQSWEAPASCPLLADLLHLAVENRRQNDAAWIERLQHDIDFLQHALVTQCSDEKGRVQTAKLSALAEFAAGAGHEINNPLAVISGQAQYVLKQMDWLDVPAEEIENVGEYLEGLREKIGPSLNKIIGQTQRIHSILTDMMQFARPSKPKLALLSVRSLVQEVTHSWQKLAEQRKVRVLPFEIAHDETLHADLGQSRIALSALLRNAIEAAPADGWVAVRIEKKTGHMLELIVEDSGVGPATSTREHLFDPFFSGRSAGRGRGLGLSTAWRFARQQGGDVRYDGVFDGVTRFVLSLPLAPVHALPAYTNGNGNGRNGSHVAVEKV